MLLGSALWRTLEFPRSSLGSEDDAGRAWWPLSIAALLAGASRDEATRIEVMGRQTLRNCSLRCRVCPAGRIGSMPKALKD